MSESGIRIIIVSAAVHGGDEKTAREKRYPLVCPSCNTARQVSFRRYLVIRKGRLSPRCHVCACAANRQSQPAYGRLCRHCTKSPVNRPLGLCWRCYYTPGVKELYPSTSKYTRRGVGSFTGNVPLPDAPTTAAPGTPEKLVVLEERAKMNRAIFHPADARYAGDPRPPGISRQSVRLGGVNDDPYEKSDPTPPGGPR